MGFIKEEERDLKNLFWRFKKRNFSGNTGQAIKNSSYQLTSNVVTKLGSFIFTIIIARLLLPEKMGLYSLALATILFFSAFSDLGISSALMTFLSKHLGKKDPKKAKAYFKKLMQWKYYLVFISSLTLIILSNFVANNYYQKPIFYALLVGAIYIPITEAGDILARLFKSKNNFKIPFFRDIIFQISRLILVPLGILFLLGRDFSNEVLIAIIILVIVLCYFISFLFLMVASKKGLPFLKSKSENLSRFELIDLKKFTIPLTVTALSGVFFGYVDTLMLGHFVSEEYIAYYSVAFNLIGSAVFMIGFISAGFFPLFSSLEGKTLKKLFKKSRNMTILLSLLGGVFTYLVSYWVIKIAYGIDYLPAVPLLRWFSILVFILPVIGIYAAYLTSQKRTKYLAGIIIFTTILNILLNFVGIKIGLKYGMFEAVLGATFATIISRFFYLGALILFRNK